MIKRITKWIHRLFETPPVVTGHRLDWNKAVQRMLEDK